MFALVEVKPAIVEYVYLGVRCICMNGRCASWVFGVDQVRRL